VLKLCVLQQDEAHHCVSTCLQTVGLYWEVDHSSELGVLPSLLIVGVVLVPLCALFSGLTLGEWWSACAVMYINCLEWRSSKTVPQSDASIRDT
jgi:hypothetical protein